MEAENSARYIEKLEKHIESSKEAERYSSDRFDVLLITLSTGSLLFSMGFAKDIVKDLAKADTGYLKLAWLMFTISIISNLVSQVSSYYANKTEIRVSKNLIRRKRYKPVLGKPSRIEWWCTALDRATVALNLLSLLSLIAGILTFVHFANVNV